MTKSEFFDPDKVAEFEGEPALLGFLLYSPKINQETADYFESAASELDVLTGTNTRFFYLCAPSEERNEMRGYSYKKIDYTEKSRAYFITPFSSLKNYSTGSGSSSPSDYVSGAYEVAFEVAALGDYFLKSEYWRMPCLVLFSSFSSKEFYIYELNDMKSEAISRFLMKLSAEASRVWKNREVPAEPEARLRVRQQVFAEIEPVLNRHSIGKKARKIVNNSAVLTIVGSVVGLL